MELRGQNKEIGMPSSLVYSPSNNRDSSSKAPSASIVSSMGERRRDHENQSHEHRSLYNPHHQQLNLQNQSHKPTRDPDLVLDPAAPAPLPASNVVTGAANTTPAPSRSFSRSPPPTSTATATATTTASTLPLVRYRECLKNHAASMGGHVVDGCGEFMPSGEEGTPGALKCAACDCHRNFHRKEVDGEPEHIANTHYKNNCSQRVTLPPPLHHQQLAALAHHPQPSLHQHHRSFPPGSLGAYAPPGAPVMMSFGGGGGVAAESSSEDLNMFQSTMQGQAAVQPSSSSKKRFRTKFSQEQKEKMMEFAEKLGWRIQKQDEQEVQQFCSQVGVRRKVFKVWMHNNKQAMKKKQM